MEQSNADVQDDKKIEQVKVDDVDKVSELLNTVTPENSAGRADSIRLLLEKAVADEALAKILHEKVEKLAQKDENGLSILDRIARSQETTGGDKLIKDAIIQPLLTSQNAQEALEQLAMCGWSDFSLPSGVDVTEDVKTRAATLTDLRIKATLVQAAIRDGRLADVETTLTDAKILRAAGISSLLPLHQAVVYGNEDIVKHILRTFPEAYELRDSTGRTALHYAAGCNDEGNLYQVLRDVGSDEDQQDVMGNTPKHYLEHPEKIQASDVKSRLENLMKGGDKPGSRPNSAKQDEADAGEATKEPDVQEVQTAESDTASKPEIQRAATPPRPKTPPGPKTVKPVSMYVRRGSDSASNQEQAPPPTTLDGKYIAQHLGMALTVALAEIAERRPWDPIEYLAQWLYAYHKNEAHAIKQSELFKAIRAAEARQNNIEEMKFKRKEEFQRMQEEEMRKKKEEEEEKRRQELEELQRSNKEAALAQKPALPTVREDEEAEQTETDAEVDDDPGVRDRDVDGLTEMHKLASQPNIDLKSLIDLGYSVADRDTKGRSVRDIAQGAGRTETVQAIDNYIKQLLSDGIVSTLEKLVLEGYNDIDILADEKLPEVTKTFLGSVDNLKQKMTQITQQSETGTEEEVKETIEALPQLTQIKDQHGHSLLHRAVVCKNASVADYLATQHPSLLQVRDNKNRTPLHYACSKSEDIAKLLISKGAKQNARDVYKKVPAYYKDNSIDVEPSQAVPTADLERTSQEQASVNNTDQSSENVGESETTPETSLLATTSVTINNPEAEATEFQGE